MDSTEEHRELRVAMKQNAELIRENNKLLKKLYRQNLIGFWVRLFWYALLIGLPFALYFYIFEPYFEAFGANYEVFKAGIGEIPGLKELQRILP